MKANKCYVEFNGKYSQEHLTVGGRIVDREIICVTGYKKGKIEVENILLDELAEGYLPSLVEMEGEYLSTSKISCLTVDTQEKIIHGLMFYLKNKQDNPVAILVEYLTDNKIFPLGASKKPVKDKINKIVYFPTYGQVFFV